MLDVLKVILLGIVEGITEWLPVSSTGHLILVGNVLKPGLSDAFMEMFNVVIQLGAIMAVVVLYFHKLNPFSPKKTQKQKLLTWQMWIKVLIACVPAAVKRTGLCGCFLLPYCCFLGGLDHCFGKPPVLQKSATKRGTENQ